MKLGQALSMVIYTSITAAAVAMVNAQTGGTGVEGLSGELLRQIQGPYRTAAVVATVACLIGAFLFLLYNEKEIMGRIDELKKESI